MKPELVIMLACPECKGDLRLCASETVSGEIRSGKLVCEVCGKVYKIETYIPRFVNADKYTDTFSYEWNRHKRTQLDSVSATKESEKAFIQKTGFDLGNLKGKVILDAGCGAGRFMEIAEKYGGQVVGVDLSFAVDVVYENLGWKRNVNVVQADIFNLPFKDNAFDYIYSIGVLHHTPNTKRAFESLLRFLKKDGEIAIWVYSNDGILMKLYNYRADLYRDITIGLPKSWLYQLAKVSVPLSYVHRIPVIGHISKLLFPTPVYSIDDWMVLDTFDWFSARYQWKHTYNEVIRWFENNGLRDIQKLGFPVSVKGTK